MPLIKVELFDYRMSDDTSAALIEKLTDALCEATHPGLRDHAWVIVEGHNPKNWVSAASRGRSTRCRRACRRNPCRQGCRVRRERAPV